MYCPQCNSESVKNQVLGKEFYYCRACKNEVYSPLSKPASEDDKVTDKDDTTARPGQKPCCSYCLREKGTYHRHDCTRATAPKTWWKSKYSCVVTLPQGALFDDVKIEDGVITWVPA